MLPEKAVKFASDGFGYRKVGQVGHGLGLVDERRENFTEPVRELAGELFVIEGVCEGVVKFQTAAIPLGTPVENFAGAFHQAQRDGGAIEGIFCSFLSGLGGANDILERGFKVGDGDTYGDISGRAGDDERNGAGTCPARGYCLYDDQA